MRKLLAGIVVFGLFLFAGVAKAETIVSGGSTISSPTTWTLSGSPYIVRGTGNISVSSVLVIEPGVVVQFEPRRSTRRYNGIRVVSGGQLVANGTVDSPISFTSAMNDPLPGDWNGIRCDGECHISFATVNYGGNIRDSFGNIDVRGGSLVEIYDSVIGDSGWNGVWIEGDAAPMFERVTIENNSGVGIDATRSIGSPSFRDSVVRGNLGALRLSVENGLDFQNTQFVGNIPQTAEFVGDTITRDTRWLYLSGISYLAPSVGRIFVRPGATLTIDAGVSVRFPRRSGLYVEGSLAAVGSSDLPIVFTSAQTLPLPGDWGGIYFDHASGIISNATIQYGGLFQDAFGGVSYGFTDRNVVMADNSVVSISDTMINDNLDTGVYSFGASSLAFNSSTIRQVPRGMFIYSHQVIRMLGNSFVSTTEYALYSAGPAQVDARDNWWGSDSGPRAVDNPTGEGESIVGNVIYDPWIRRTRRDPVILIPGILGTEMYRGTELMWVDAIRAALDLDDSFMYPLALLENGSPSDSSVVHGDIIREVTGGVLDYFDGLIREFEADGYTEGEDLFVFPYDWRLDMRDTSRQLETRINEILAQTGAEKVDIVAHSAGGMLTRWYLSRDNDHIDSVVFVGVPHLGAPKAAKVLLFGDDLGFGVDISAGRRISFINHDTMRRIARNMTLLYQLLPTRSFVESVGPYLYDLTQRVALDFDESRAFLAQFDLNDAHLGQLDAYAAPTIDFASTSISAYNISGCETPTIRRILQRNEGTEDEYYLQLSGGDGTVPLESSNAVVVPLERQFYVHDIEHATMASQESTRRLIADLITGQAPTLPDKITQDSTACAPTGQMVSVHSPVDIHVYDSAGNHVGPTADNAIEIGIPFVAYENIGNNKFVFLPDAQETYRIVLDATATGTFSFRVADIEQGEITQTIYYGDIPIIPQSSGNMTLFAGGVSDFEVDSNIIPPSSILNAGGSQDFVKPSTTIHLIGTEVANDWFRSTAGVSLSAADDNSGILKTEYSLDSGETWREFALPFTISTEGETLILYRSVDRAGNKESIQEYIIRIDTIAPEANIAFDLAAADIIVSGLDANSTTVSTTESGVMIADEAGNTLLLEMEKRSHERTTRFRILGISYNGAPAETQKNHSVIHWFKNRKNGQLEHLEQFIAVPHDFHLASVYNRHKDETMIVGWERGAGKIKKRLSGLHLLRLQTNHGELQYYY